MGRPPATDDAGDARTKGRLGLLLASLAVHLVLLAAPAVLIGDQGLFFGDRGGLVFLGLASLLGLVDASILSRQSASARAWDLRCSDGQLLSALSGLSLLLLFWSVLLSRLWALGEGKTGTSPLLVLGAALMLCGLGLRLLAIHSLGPAFESEPEPRAGAKLRRTGLHAHLRHPSETGLALVAVGACFFGHGPAAVTVLLLLLVPVTALRLREEERALTRAFGQAHRAYRRDVPAFLPWRLASSRLRFARPLARS